MTSVDDTKKHHPKAEGHKLHRAGWLRAAVLGADDGIVSTASLMIGVAASSASHSVILTAGFAGLAAGAMAMAAGEYVSVSSQRDAEEADLAREAHELEHYPEAELRELAGFYIERGLTKELAVQVAEALSKHDALGSHAREELGILEMSKARPVQAALASAAAFASGAALPIVALVLAPSNIRTIVIVAVAVVALGVIGFLGATVGGAKPWRATLRVMIGGSLAMAVTAAVGALVGHAGL
ncbi:MULTISPECIES: VIT1/CCC1 transporter family protein [Acidithrix]|uniref:VIT family protein n=1 Tax=Acidithrix ferrooxidans TaxID=1280514 RepID=A0A0D8HFI5_9ACTN|nr:MULTISPECIES: VIT1/CCC1 transporter family protein [Acidithrix]KJF16725.1 VIT family protein [Acidithrix ferrooxidans]CAG4934319.1 unnamed protein product [Acidithrix sp. C25]